MKHFQTHARIYIVAAALIAVSIKALAGGNYNETTTPIAGQTTIHDRMCRLELSNDYGQAPVLEFTVETVKTYPDGEVKRTFKHRNTLNSAEYLGRNVQIPLLNPQSGEQIGEQTFTPEQYYAINYSLFIFAEQEKTRKETVPVGDVSMQGTQP